MERLTMDHICGLIDKEEYVVEEQYVQCILSVGEAPVIGISYRFSKATHNPDMAKKAARDDAIRQLFSLEAYHQKRLRPKMDAQILDLKLGNQFEEPMAERDVPLMFNGINCQEALKEYLASPESKMTSDEQCEQELKEIVTLASRVRKEEFTETQFVEGGDGVMEINRKVEVEIPVTDNSPATCPDQYMTDQ